MSTACFEILVLGLPAASMEADQVPGHAAVLIVPVYCQRCFLQPTQRYWGKWRYTAVTMYSALPLPQHYIHDRYGYTFLRTDISMRLADTIVSAAPGFPVSARCKTSWFGISGCSSTSRGTATVLRHI